MIHVHADVRLMRSIFRRRASRAVPAERPKHKVRLVGGPLDGMELDASIGADTIVFPIWQSGNFGQCVYAVETRIFRYDSGDHD